MLLIGHTSSFNVEGETREEERGGREEENNVAEGGWGRFHRH